MSFHRLAAAGVKGSKFTLFGDGEQSRDFTFISDIVDANLLAAEKGRPGDVFNIGGGTRATMNEVVDIMRGYLGSLEVEKTEKQAGDARHTSADTSRAAAVLGFKPKVSLKEGIRREVEWMRELLTQ